MIYEKLPKDIASLTSQAPQGIHRLCKKHPMVKIVTSEIDDSRTITLAKNESLNGAFTVIQDKERIYYNIQKKWTSCRSQSPYPPAYVAPQRSGESRSLQDSKAKQNRAFRIQLINFKRQQSMATKPNTSSMNSSSTTSTTSKEHRNQEKQQLQQLRFVWTSEPVRIVNHHANRTFYICCNKEVERLPLRELPSPLKELLGTPGFRVLISVANGMIAFTSTGAHVDHTITGQPGHSFT
ncbi:hypothetical protein IGI04_035122 [Brassica rapa subsp. trilocularis]|uniref:Uncharacterized protein n=1 Tax=Brassica rapa subsp. trilocularis TaxID=1813537 RepID=A0ABQ7LBP9_BRACM|nr:hypothetical protein IGI04_035122 [Brassica rapa subsp. trilocularis]